MTQSEESDDKIFDEIFEKIDSWFWDSDFYLCNDYLKNLDISEYSANIVVAILAITFCAKDQLPDRPEFCKRARIRLEELGLDSDRIEKLVKKRE